MKIVYLSSSIIPSRAANSVHVMKMCQAFSKNGHEVILHAPARTCLEEKTNDFYEFYGVKDIFEVKKLPWLKIKGRGYIFGFLSAWNAKRENPDLAYGRNLASCYFASAFGLETMYEAHQPVNENNKIQSFLFKHLIKSSNFKRLVVISNSLKEHYLNKYNISENKILVAHDGADISKQLPTDQLYKFDNDKLNVGYIGQLYPGKGMKIISKLVEECPWAHFHIVGGNEEDILFWKEKLSNHKNFTFYGYVSNSKTDKYRQSFDVVLAPYQKKVSTYGKGNCNIAEWMSPLKIFEYMAAGKAIVASDLPVLKEVLTDNESAKLCNPDKIEEWVNALRNLKNNLKLRYELGNSAKEKLLSYYTWVKRAKDVIN